MAPRTIRKKPASAAGPRRPAPRPDPDESARTQAVADRLHTLAIHLLRWLRKEDEALGLSGSRLSALSVVVFAGPVSLGDLAAAEQVRPPSMTPVVLALEQAGLVKRRAHPADRRTVLVEATAKGREQLTRGRRLRVGQLANLLEGFPARELDELERTVDMLRQKLEDDRSG